MINQTICWLIGTCWQVIFLLWNYSQLNYNENKINQEIVNQSKWIDIVHHKILMVKMLSITQYTWLEIISLNKSRWLNFVATFLLWYLDFTLKLSFNSEIKGSAWINSKDITFTVWYRTNWRVQMKEKINVIILRNKISRSSEDVQISIKILYF